MGALPIPQLGSRALFPDLRIASYLNHAAISPASLAVLAAVQAVTDDYASQGVHAMTTWLAQRNRLRGKLAGLVGARPEQIGLVPSTSTGLIDLALCIDWKSGDRVVLFEGEFPANVTPWQAAARQFGLQIVFVPQDLEAVEQQLRRGARLVAASAVQFQTGRRMPTEQLGVLCARYGAELAVDAIQALGAVPFDVGGVDYLACGSHKWLMGLEGCGFVYVRDATRLVPRVTGWLSHEEPVGFLFEGPGRLRYDRPIRQSASIFELGASNTVGFAALEASLDCILHLGVDAIHAHVGRILDGLEAGMVARGWTSLRERPGSATLSMLPPPVVSVVGLPGRLLEHGVSVSIPDGRLRMAPHWPNSPDEVPLVLDAVDRVVGGLS